jgi:hypothetical protein
VSAGCGRPAALPVAALAAAGAAVTWIWTYVSPLAVLAFVATGLLLAVSAVLTLRRYGRRRQP